MSAPEEDCPICNASGSAKEQFARGKVAEHVKRKARHDDTHREWIDEHTDDGTLVEIRAALRRSSAPTDPS
jgi:hypothetical protein